MTFHRKNFMQTSIGRAFTRIKSYFVKNNSIIHQPVQASKKGSSGYRHFPISRTLARARFNFDRLTDPARVDRAYNARRQYRPVDLAAKAETKRIHRNLKRLIDEVKCRENYYYYHNLAWNKAA